MKFKFIFCILVAFTTIGCNINTPEIPNEPSDTPTKENGYDYIDLGLSVKWATCNIGAKRPEEFGDYFAWGETKPKSTYDWSTYNWCRGTNETLTKYNNRSRYGIADNKTTLELTDDAAHTNWGGKWRIPTKSEWEELQNNTTWKEVINNGIYGYEIVSHVDINAKIFLPAACYDDEEDKAGSNMGFCIYWANSINVENPYEAHCLESSINNFHWGTMTTDRCFGVPIRAVFQ